MNDDPLEGTSELFASVLGDVSVEQWESFKEEQNELGMHVLDYDTDDSYDSDRSISSIGDGYLANVELIEEDDYMECERSDDETSNSGTAWGCDAALKYVNGEISFSELNEIMEDKAVNRTHKKKSVVKERQLSGKGDFSELNETMQDKADKPHSRKKKSVGEENQPPDEEESQVERGYREYQMEMKNKAKRGRRKMNKLPKEHEGLMGAANLNFAKGNTEDAIKMCMELIRLAPTAQEPFQTLAVIYDEMGEMRKSFQCYLVAACLNPSDTEEWIRLAGLSIEQNQIHQAISCYSHAIRNDRSNISLLWERCNLYDQVGDRKKAIAGYELILEQLSNPEDGDKCVEMSREIAKVHHGNKDFINAIKVLETAFTKFPSLITSEDVNFLLELQLAEKFHKEAVKNFVQHCGVTLKMSDREINSHEQVNEMSKEDFSAVEGCYVPEVLPIDLWVKILICLIYLRSMKAIEPLLDSLLSEKPSEIGDLYLDVAEALMDTSKFKYANVLLQKLLVTSDYDLPAVWMKYADCLFALSDVEEAIKAYNNVILMAPTYQEARLALSKIYLSAGKVEDAMSILRQEYEEGKESILGLEALYQRCRLLEKEERWDEFISAGILLQYSHCYMIETEEEFSAVLANQTAKRRNEALRDMKENNNKSLPKFVGANIEVSNLWDIYKKVSNKLMELKRFPELMNLSLSVLTSTKFMKNRELIKEVDFQALLSCFFNKNYYYAYLLVKDLVLRNLNNTAAWNLFSLIVTYSQENRHNRFCLRLMMKHQDHLALGFLNGHNAMISGTYKHALGEYMCILKERPDDPYVTFYVGIAFIHMACQKFATKRHFLTIQGYAFLMQYLKLKGGCQESYYNIGRALHQLGIKDAAIHYYKKALEAPLLIHGKDAETFDLRREIAYNLSLIYQSTGAMDLAIMYSRKYITI